MPSIILTITIINNEKTTHNCNSEKEKERGGEIRRKADADTIYIAWAWAWGSVCLCVLIVSDFAANEPVDRSVGRLVGWHNILQATITSVTFFPSTYFSSPFLFPVCHSHACDVCNGKRANMNDSKIHNTNVCVCVCVRKEHAKIIINCPESMNACDHFGWMCVRSRRKNAQQLIHVERNYICAIYIK